MHTRCTANTFDTDAANGFVGSSMSLANGSGRSPRAKLSVKRRTPTELPGAAVGHLRDRMIRQRHLESLAVTDALKNSEKVIPE